MEISWTDRVKNEEVLQKFQEDRNMLQRIKRRNGNWIGHTLRTNCFLRHLIGGETERRIEVTGRRGRRRKQLPDDFKETRGYCKLKAEATDRTLWRTGCGRGCGPVVRRTVE